MLCPAGDLQAFIVQALGPLLIKVGDALYWGGL